MFYVLYLMLVFEFFFIDLCFNVFDTSKSLINYTKNYIHLFLKFINQNVLKFSRWTNYNFRQSS